MLSGKHDEKLSVKGFTSGSSPSSFELSSDVISWKIIFDMTPMTLGLALEVVYNEIMCGKGVKDWLS